MSARPHLFPYFSTTEVDESAANTETVIGTVGPCGMEFPNQSVILHGYAAIALAASTSTMTLRVRRTSLTGTQVGTDQPITSGITASKLAICTIDVVDTPTGDAAFVYVLTMQATAGAAAAAAKSIAILATVC